MPFEGHDRFAENAPTPIPAYGVGGSVSAKEGAPGTLPETQHPDVAAGAVEVAPVPAPEVAEGFGWASATESSELSETREINLASAEGLGMFLTAAEDIYADASQYEAEAMSEGFERLKGVDLGSDDAYEAFSGLYEMLGDIQERVDEMRYEYLPAGKEVPDEVVDALQDLYNDMIFRRDAILGAYASEVEAVEGGLEEEPDPLFEASASPRWESEAEPNLEEHRRQVKEELVAFLKSKQYKGIAKRLRRSVDVAGSVAELNRIRHNIMNSKEWDQPAVPPAPVAVPMPEPPPTEPTPTPEAAVPQIESESPSGIPKERFERASQVVSAVVTLAEVTEQELQSALSATPSPAAAAGMNALQAEIARGKEMMMKIAELSDSAEEASVIEGTLERYQRIATTKLQQNINGLAELVRKELGVASDESESAPVVTEETVAEMETAQEAAEREREVAALLEAVRANQFLAVQERETVRAMYGELQRRVKALRPKSELDQAVQNLRSYVEDLSTHPDVDLLQERAQNVLDHIAPAKASNPDFVMSAHSLKAIIDRIAADPEGTKDELNDSSTEERLVNAYLNLERHALDHESEWLSVCGMVVPKAGPEGVYGARSFREGLLVARDTHPDLVRSPERQQMVDRIIRILARVPASGITGDEEKEIHRLAKLIDAPLRVVEARQRAGAAGAERAAAPAPVVPMPKRKVMEVQASPEDDGDIEITVAQGAVDEIIEQEVETETEDQPEVVEELKAEPDGPAVIETLEERDVINHVLPANIPSVPEAGPVDAESLTRKYLTDTRYTEFINQYFGSSEGFERVLMSEVKKIEEQTRDSFEKWLGEEYASPFHTYLKELTLDELNALQSKGHDELKDDFQRRNIKYETFVTWLDLYAQMREEVGENGHMTFGELFARWIIETEMTYYGENTDPSQFTL